MTSRVVLILLAVVSVAVLANCLPHNALFPNELLNDLPTDPQPGQFCDICKQVVQQAKDSGSVEWYKHTFRQLCKFCPAKDQCEATIDKVAKSILTKSPEEVCEEAGLCSAQQLPGFLQFS